jgi:hypothetical protein
MLEIIGCDSETFKGEPISFQFWSVETKFTRFIWTSKSKSFSNFIEYCKALPLNDSIYVLYALNLEFDLISFFYDRLPILRNEEINFEYDDFKITGIYSDTCFIKLRRSHQTIWVIDISAFLSGSLERLANLFCPDIHKLKKPANLGQYNFRAVGRNKINFINYAMRDAQICCHIGQYIQKFHEQYNISQCVSLPQAAGKIFRHKFMKADIPRPHKGIEFASLYSYHGGKNGFYVEPGLYKDCIGLDIISAYSWAMSKLPSFYEKSLYKEIRSTDKILPLGVYKIWGYVTRQKYPLLFRHDFKPINQMLSMKDYQKIINKRKKAKLPISAYYSNYMLEDGNVVLSYADGIWVTGWELEKAIKCGHIILQDYYGYAYDSEKDNNESPFKNFVDEFFKLKETASDEINRYFAKLTLNSLYGKFIENHYKAKWFFDIKKNKITGDEIVIRAGGLFHPFIATAITGMVRRRIFEFENSFNSLHTATDGIITQDKKAALIKNSNIIGDIKKEFVGDVLFLRNKLYIVYSDIPNKDNIIKSRLYPSKYIIKYALHAFHGKVQLLEELIKRNKYNYRIIKVNKLKESLNRDLVPNNFESRNYSLKGISLKCT